MSNIETRMEALRLAHSSNLLAEDVVKIAENYTRFLESDKPSTPEKAAEGEIEYVKVAILRSHFDGANTATSDDIEKFARVAIEALNRFRVRSK